MPTMSTGVSYVNWCQLCQLVSAMSTGVSYVNWCQLCQLVSTMSTGVNWCQLVSAMSAMSTVPCITHLQYTHQNDTIST